jgi:hypothetical protein
MDRVDVHQHLWSEPLVAALSGRRELPFARRENGLTILYMAGERPYVLDLEGEAPSRRSALVDSDGLDRALLCLSSPLGIETLPRKQALAVLDAYHEGALSLGEPFGVWASIALDGAQPDDIDRAVARGCEGLCLPAGAIADVERVERLRPLLARLEALSVPLLVHPGAGAAQSGHGSLRDPLWWPALTRYVADMNAAWHAFVAAGRGNHPNLRVVFAMLAGLAPLHAERLRARGGPATEPDPLIFYDTSSYGPAAVGAVAARVGAEQLLYGSDRPVVEPSDPELEWAATLDGTRRAFGSPAGAVAR